MKKHKKLIYPVLLLLLLLVTEKSYSQQKVVIGYIPGWTNMQTVIDNTDLSAITHINIAFLNPNSSGAFLSGGAPVCSDATASNINYVVSQAHARGVKVLASLGGGSVPSCSGNWATLLSSSRTTVVNNLVALCNTFNLDGIDVDIEGSVLTTIVDAGNYTPFIQALRNALNPLGKLVTCATAAYTGGIIPASSFQYFDYVNIMSYDNNWGSSGNHSTYADAVTHVQRLIGLGCPASKLVLGIPFYGYTGVVGTGGIAFKTIIDTYGSAAANVDTYAGINYNGITTIKNKTQFAKDNITGIMIWELSQDATGAYSLLAAIKSVMQVTPIPAAPSNLVATAVSTSQINLNWNDVSNNESLFRIERSADGINGWTSISTLSPNSTSYSNTGLNAGTTYYYRARAENASGNSAYSNTANATTNNSNTQSPYSGTPITITGTVEAENFDNGGEGQAYHDVDATNNGGQYRITEGVDLEACSEGGYNVGWVNSGEWLEYSVNVGTGGNYTIETRVASTGTGGSFHIEFGGVNKTGVLTVPNSGGWQTWTSVIKTAVSLSAGNQIMRIYIDGSGFNFNRLTLTAESAIIPVTGVSVSPTSTTLNVGNTTQLTATVLPANATNKAITWSSGNTSIATVNSNGLVTGIAAGSATITVRTTDGGYTATCAVTVNGTSTGTDITNLGGTITTQYTGSPANEGIAMIIDNNSNTKFLTFYASAWVQYQAPSSYIVTSYSITSANDAAERDPLNWTLQGSNNGTTWTTMNTQSAQDFATRLLRRTFSFANSTAYTHYRFNFTNNSGTILQVAEVELFGTAVSTGFTTTIQAESYSTMAGVATETTTDAGGGLNVGWIQTGDWMSYPAVTIPAAGTYTIEYRVASMSGGGSLRFELAGGTPIYGTLAVPSTGGWQTWTNIKHTVTLSAGSQSFAIYALAGGWNINWFAITQGVKSTENTQNEIKDLILSVYPNPTSGLLYIEGLENEAVLELFTISGQKIKQDSGKSIDLSGLGRGLYIIRITDASHNQSLIFSKE